jgi:hypothetical protein
MQAASNRRSSWVGQPGAQRLCAQEAQPCSAR